jgi:hypothetical protein
MMPSAGKGVCVTVLDLDKNINGIILWRDVKEKVGE